MAHAGSPGGRGPVTAAAGAEGALSRAAGAGPAAPPAPLPSLRHLAVIPDGNRRWAKAKGLPSLEGHRRGCERTLELLDRCRTDTAIEVLTLWTTSVENLGRPRAEVDPGLPVIAEFVRRVASAGQWRVGFLGDLDRLPPPMAAELRDHAHRSSSVPGPLVNFALAYSGQDEITRAVRRLLVSRAADGHHPCEQQPLTAGDLARHLDTAGLPDPDLVIRTSGETRLSGFMPWQTLHSELYFSPVLWPDFDACALEEALEDYRGRQRRRGM
ncbi:polyprenyl diphosphate synthase (plasmid) [Streptomyces sp. CA-294286]|uniref:polyprenyl diphosphate synthase n=1 Tax=Streptomyces sp. CA-294286 TaxID=3240070 RepID=UPI003D92E31B